MFVIFITTHPSGTLGTGAVSTESNAGDEDDEAAEVAEVEGG